VRELGVDVGAGGDESVICSRVGYRCRIVLEDREPNTMKTLANVIREIRTHKAKVTKIDKTGIGTGMCNRAEELFNNNKLDIKSCYNEISQLYELPIVGIMVGASAVEKDIYLNLRAYGYWMLRCLFEQGLIDIDENDEDLAAQLVSIKYKPNESGKIQISPKSPSTKAKSGNDLEVIKSPGRADALMLCCLTHWEKVKPSATPLAGLRR